MVGSTYESTTPKWGCSLVVELYYTTCRDAFRTISNIYDGDSKAVNYILEHVQSFMFDMAVNSSLNFNYIELSGQ